MGRRERALDSGSWRSARTERPVGSLVKTEKWCTWFRGAPCRIMCAPLLCASVGSLRLATAQRFPTAQLQAAADDSNCGPVSCVDCRVGRGYEKPDGLCGVCAHSRGPGAGAVRRAQGPGVRPGPGALPSGETY
eukprot:3117785-Prymnesium_polylepis.1